MSFGRNCLTSAGTIAGRCSRHRYRVRQRTYPALSQQCVLKEPEREEKEVERAAKALVDSRLCLSKLIGAGICWMESGIGDGTREQFPEVVLCRGCAGIYWL